MPRARNLDELRRLRQQTSDASHAARGGQTKITIGMGTCGIAAGAREVLHAFLEELQRRNLEAHVSTASCVGRCAQEPLVEVELSGGRKVTYGRVAPSSVPHLVEEHLVNGRIVEKWVVSPPE